MKKVFYLLAIIGFQGLSAQEQTTDKAFFLEPMFRIYGTLPMNFGDNYLADANEGKTSFGFNMSMFEYHDFRLVLGFDRIYYKVTDAYKAADVRKSIYNSFYGNISYEIPVVNKLTVQPYVGLGTSTIGFLRSSRSNDLDYRIGDGSIDKQQGFDVRVGTNIDYNINEIISVFAGVTYVASRYTIQTIPELESYYGKSKMLQLNVGLKIGYSFKKKQLAQPAPTENTTK